jgi:hypothetical protein
LHGSLAKLKPADISTAYANALVSGRRKDGAGLSARTVLHIHRVLKQALAQDRNLSVAQRLKLLNNFSWSSSPMRVDRVERESLRTVLDGWSGAS